jgi:putative oxidoreductase
MSLFTWLSASAPRILGLLRILSGTMFALHGAQKVLGLFGGVPAEAPALIIWTAGPIELVGGALIALGLFTRPSAFLSSGLMAFAYFIGHGSRGFLPITNGGELAVLYCWLFLYLAAHGPGAFSLDGLRGRTRPAA